MSSAKTLTRISTALLSGLFLAPLLASAQLVSDPLSFRVTPEVPAPGERTLVTALIFPPLDAAATTITWSLNGRAMESGPNKATFEFDMGPAGQETVIGVVVTQPGGISVERTLTFRPADVELVWEARTYTPPFYGGRAWYTPGASITVVAFPNVRSGGGTVDASNLIFNWERDDEPVQAASGRGRSTLTFTGNQIHAEEVVGVRVTRLDGSLAAQKEVAIPAREPFILFYARDPLRGIRYEQALTGRVQLKAQETTLVAEPYFFSTPSRSGGAIAYSWTLNGNPITTGDAEEGMITLRHDAADEGSAVLALQIQHLTPQKILQGAETALELLFGPSRTSFFGITI